MPPRHHYWTIILEGKPTAFRAHTQEELAPTLRQLQARHPEAVMKWFARGRLWESQEEERAEAFARRRAPAPREQRPRDWRPGGEHRDPRDRFKIPRDEKRRRFAEQLRRDERPDAPTRERPPRERPPREHLPREGPPRDERRPAFGRPPRPDRPGGFGRPAGPRGPGNRPGGGARGPGGRSPSGGGPPSGGRPAGRRPPGGRPHGGRPPGGRKPGGGGNRGGGGRGR
jgi:23S rRNA pseudouridine2605 synthase